MLFQTLLVFLQLMNKHCTTDRELSGNLCSLTINDYNIIGSDHFIIVLNDHKPNVSCFTEKSNLSPKSYTAQKQLNKIQKLRNNCTK